MDYNFQFRDKISAVVEGAETLEGERLVELLAKHPWFQIVDGKSDVYLIFSTLADPPKNAGVPVLTTRSGLGDRVLPEVNGNVLRGIEANKRPLVISHPSGIASALALALKPLDHAFGLQRVESTILLPIESRGIASLDLLDSAMPVAGDCERTLQEDLRALLGRSELIVGAKSVRIAMTAGLLQYVTVTFSERPAADDILSCWANYRGHTAGLDLLLAPEQPLQVCLESGYPQPRLHRSADRGMTVSVGSLEPAQSADYRFAVVSDPVMRGPVGGALLNAELLVKQGLVFW